MLSILLFPKKGTAYKCSPLTTLSQYFFSVSVVLDFDSLRSYSTKTFVKRCGFNECPDLIAKFKSSYNSTARIFAAAKSDVLSDCLLYTVTPLILILACHLGTLTEPLLLRQRTILPSPLISLYPSLIRKLPVSRENLHNDHL